MEHQKHSFYKFIFSFLLVFSAMGTMASPTSLTYQGRILKTDGTPLNYNNVSFIFQIMDTSGSCLLYQEQVTGYNMTNSGGVFDIPIGQGTVLYPLAPTSILEVFNNTGAFSCGTCSLVNGNYSCTSASGTYTASNGDTRKLRVSFYDGSGWKTITPDNVIRSVPYASHALSAQKLGNNVANDFLLKAGLPTCGAGTYLSYDGTALSCVPVSGASGGTVTSITAGTGLTGGTINSSGTIALATTGVTAGAYGSATQVPVIDIDAHGRVTAVTPTTISGVSPAGAASGDLSGSYPNPSVSSLNGIPLAVTGTTDGHVLKYNSGQWVNALLGISDIAGLSGTLSGYLTSAAFNSYVSSASCSTSQSMYWNSVSGTFSCQSISVGGDISGTVNAMTVNKIKGVDVDTTGLTTGHVLKYDGSKWAPAADNNTSQWSTAGSDIYYNLGNVGIGTASPERKMHISEGNQYTGLQLQNTNTGGRNYSLLTSGGSAAIGQGKFSIFDEDAGAFRMTVDATGKVGIGTTAPETNLQIVDSSGGHTSYNKQLEIFATAGGDAGLSLRSDIRKFILTTSRDGKFHLWDYEADVSRLSIDPSGTTRLGNVYIQNTPPYNIGISNSTPAYKLDVDGDVNVSGAFKVNGVNIAAGGGSVTNVSSANGDITVTSNSTTPVLTLNSGTGANQILKLDGSGKIPTATLPSSVLTTATTFSGDVSGSSAATAVDKIKGVPLSFTSLTSGNFLRYNGSNWINATPSVADLSDGSSLIKSSQMPANCSAGQTLTFSSPTGTWVCSDIVVTASNFSSQTANTFLAAPTGAAGTPTFRNIAAADLPAGVATQWTTSGSNIYYNTGKVGIKTNSPSNSLHVVGENLTATALSNSMTNAAFLIQPNYNSTLWGLAFGTTGGTNYAQYIQAANPSGSSAKDIVVNPFGGRVGIGTNSPYGKTEIRSDFGGYATRSTNYSGDTTYPTLYVHDPSLSVLRIANDQAAGNDNILEFVNTQQAGNKWEVAHVANELHVRRDNSSVMTYVSNGNVGIGTTAPAALLSVGSQQSVYGAGTYPVAAPRAVMSTPLGASGTVATALHLDASSDTAFNKGLALEMGYAHPNYGHYTSRIVHYGDTANTVGSRLQIQTHSGAHGIWNTGLFMNEAGNVGIGTTNPIYAIDVYGSSGTNGVIRGTSGFVAKASGIYGSVGLVGGSATMPGYIEWRMPSAEGTSGVRRGFMGWDDNNIGLTLENSSNFLVNGGNVGIGTAAPSTKLEVAGDVKAEGFISTSDQRLKKNIEPIKGLEAVLQLNGYTYQWKKTGEHDAGVLAQEVEKVFPDAVRTDARTGYKGVKYQYLIAPLIEATKEVHHLCQQTEKTVTSQARGIASLESDVQKLKYENTSLKDELSAVHRENRALQKRLEKIEALLGAK